MLRRLWILVAISWLVGGSAWVVSSGWWYVEYQRDEIERREGIAAFEAYFGKTFKEWQDACLRAPQKPATGYFPPPGDNCDSPGPMPPRHGMDYYTHEISVLAPLIYSHFREPLFWNVLLPILISGPLVLWLIPWLTRWVRYGSNAPTEARSSSADVAPAVTRRRP